jgi:DNA-binding transcriptional ArsR family regulator
VLRLVFTAEDLARITFHGFAEWPETVLSLRLLFGPTDAPAAPPPPALHDWRREMLRTLTGSPLEEPLRALSGTLSPGQPPPASLPPSLLPAYRRIALEPCRTRVTGAVQAELRRRASALLHGGYAASLGGLGGHSAWSGSVLTAAHPVPAELKLAGQGLTLQPCYFCPRETTLLLGTAARPTLLYSVHGCAYGSPPGSLPGPATGPASSPVSGSPPDTAPGFPPASLPAYGHRQAPAAGAAALLGTLFGSTRAQALLAVGAGCSTTELAQRLKVSLATASQHASALRTNGLLSTHRRGRRVEHLPTDLALRLLDACRPGPSTVPPTVPPEPAPGDRAAAPRTTG